MLLGLRRSRCRRLLQLEDDKLDEHILCAVLALSSIESSGYRQTLLRLSKEIMFRDSFHLQRPALRYLIRFALLPVQAVAIQSSKEVHVSQNNGIITIPSRYSVEETVHRLQAMLAAKNVEVFALIDHSGEAAKAGFEMRPCKLLIFGNPKAGTPLMLASPTTALDLPLKILVWERPDRAVLLSYNDASWLQQRHGFPGDLIGNISVADTLAAKAAE